MAPPALLPVLLLLTAYLAPTARAQNSISTCPLDSSCVPIKTCSSIISLLSIAKDTDDQAEKRKIISQVRERVCGERRDRLICCPADSPADLQGALTPGNT